MHPAKFQFSATKLIWPALVGATLSIPVEFVGTLYVGEVLLLVPLIHTLFFKLSTFRRWPRFVRPLLLSMLLLILGYLASDLLTATSTHDMLRGSARTVFVLLDFCGLLAVVDYSVARFQAVLVGYSVIAVALVLPDISQDNFLSFWKFSIGFPLTIGIAMLLGSVRTLGPFIAPLAVMALGMLHILLDSRSMGVVCIVVSAILLAQFVRASRWRVLAWPAAMAAIALAVVLITFSLSEGSESSSRRFQSNTWRLAAIEVAVGEIVSSPFVGHGSWASNSNLVDAMVGKQADRGSSPGADSFYTVHSMLLQAWFEGGLLALSFPLLYGTAILRGIRAVWQLGRTSAQPRLLVLLILVNGLDHLLFSPFNGFIRIYIALVISSCVVTAGWRQSQFRHLYEPANPDWPSRYDGASRRSVTTRSYDSRHRNHLLQSSQLS